MHIIPRITREERERESRLNAPSEKTCSPQEMSYDQQAEAAAAVCVYIYTLVRRRSTRERERERDIMDCVRTETSSVTVPFSGFADATVKSSFTFWELLFLCCLSFSRFFVVVEV